MARWEIEASKTTQWPLVKQQKKQCTFWRHHKSSDSWQAAQLCCEGRLKLPSSLLPCPLAVSEERSGTAKSRLHSPSLSISIDLPAGGGGGRGGNDCSHVVVTILRLCDVFHIKLTKQGTKPHMILECRRFSSGEMHWNALWEEVFLRLSTQETERERDMKVLYECERGREMQTDSLPEKESLSQTWCVGFGGGSVEIIFILKVEDSRLSDHSKHGQLGFRLWLRWLQGVWTVGGGLGCFSLFFFLSSSSPPTPAAVDVGHHGEFVQSHSVGGKD